jgi:F-type H+-transporting ATPase subunit gamma
MKAVANIRRITKTMQMIATARFQAAQRRATQAQPYTRKIAELVGELAANVGDGEVTHPLLKAPSPAVKRQLLLVITSNRGLCGAYNANVLRAATAYLRKNTGTQIDVEVVGKKAVSFFRFNKVNVSQFHSQFGDKPEYEDVQRLAESYMQRFSEGQYDSVSVVSMEFQSMAKQAPRVLQILPLRRPDAGNTQKAAAQVDYDFSPEPERLLNELLPITVKTQLFQCFNEAAVSEHIARMVAMKSATDAATKMGKNLTRKFNRARQAAITTELSEIIAGAAALN